MKGCIWWQKEQLHVWINTFSNLASTMLILRRTHTALKVGMILFSATFLFPHTSTHIWPDCLGKFWEATLLCRINHTVTAISWEEVENSSFHFLEQQHVSLSAYVAFFFLKKKKKSYTTFTICCIIQCCLQSNIKCKYKKRLYQYTIILTESIISCPFSTNKEERNVKTNVFFGKYFPNLNKKRA